jgi:hypothetical protein
MLLVPQPSITEQTIVSGAMVLIWFIMWWKVVKSGPEEDPHISPEELKYIQQSLGNSTHKVLADLGNLLHITSSSFHYENDSMKLSCKKHGRNTDTYKISISEA